MTHAELAEYLRTHKRPKVEVLLEAADVIEVWDRLFDRTLAERPDFVDAVNKLKAQLARTEEVDKTLLAILTEQGENPAGIRVIVQRFIGFCFDVYRVLGLGPFEVSVDAALETLKVRLGTPAVGAHYRIQHKVHRDDPIWLDDLCCCVDLATAVEAAQDLLARGRAEEVRVVVHVPDAANTVFVSAKRSGA